MLSNIEVVADFHEKLTKKQIRKLAMDSKQDDGENYATEQDIEVAIEKAENWLRWAADIIAKTFELMASGKGVARARVAYREGEDLGFTCKNSGSSPFNTIYHNGPTVHVILPSDVSVSHALGSTVELDSFQPLPQGGYLLITRIPKQNLYVAFRNKRR